MSVSHDPGGLPWTRVWAMAAVASLAACGERVADQAPGMVAADQPRYTGRVQTLGGAAIPGCRVRVDFLVESRASVFITADTDGHVRWSDGGNGPIRARALPIPRADRWEHLPQSEEPVLLLSDARGAALRIGPGGTLPRLDSEVFVAVIPAAGQGVSTDFCPAFDVLASLPPGPATVLVYARCGFWCGFATAVELRAGETVELDGARSTPAREVSGTVTRADGLRAAGRVGVRFGPWPGSGKMPSPSSLEWTADEFDSSYPADTKGGWELSEAGLVFWTEIRGGGRFRLDGLLDGPGGLFVGSAERPLVSVPLGSSASQVVELRLPE